MWESMIAVISGILVPIILCAAGVFYAFRLRFFHILKPHRVIAELLHGGDKSSDGVGSLGAVTLALAGTLGVGNIVGVAAAIHLGGFGAVFWIWVSAVFAMLLKYAEIVLAMLHKRYDKDGNASGCAMYYIEDFFTRIRCPRLGITVARIFAAAFLICSLCMGSMLQSHSVAEALEGVMSIPSPIVGIILGGAVLLIAKRGAGGIVKFTNFLVPFMSIGYVVMSLTVIFLNIGELSGVFRLIFSCVFSGRAALGGVGGFAFMRAVRYGVMRGLVSNEAGCGTAPTAHALANSSPAHQGLWGIFEVFADTVLMCTLSAVVIILGYGSASIYEGNYMMMSVAAFSSLLGRWAEYFLCAAVLCFGFATICCWVHYGKSAALYLFSGKHCGGIFIVIYSVCTSVGAVLSADIAWQLSDLSMGIMTIINLTVITAMSGEVKKQETVASA